MSGGSNEVETAVHASVWNDPLPGDAHFLVQVVLKLVIDIFQDGLPAVAMETREGIMHYTISIYTAQV